MAASINACNTQLQQVLSSQVTPRVSVTSMASKHMQLTLAFARRKPALLCADGGLVPGFSHDVRPGRQKRQTVEGGNVSSVYALQ